MIKWVARHDLHRLRQFLQGDQVDVPQEALQALDIVLRELPATKDGYSYLVLSLAYMFTTLFSLSKSII